MVAQFRAACSACPFDEGFQAVPAEVKGASPEFTELWERRNIEDAGQILVQRRVQHDRQVGPRRHLGEHRGEAGVAASPEGRRGAMYPVAGLAGRFSVCSGHDRQQRA
ncbi:hypothetical protein ABZV31_00415 [Streptomyces sp. NPDC005202]|uniref:MmyB family transcriptional regulator n=1 Tax=Streptomyces sp. NPDC005202 TaxID=3157021 RepID=UPI00339FFBB9